MDYMIPAFACFLPFVGGIPGGIITRRNTPNWYATIKKPSWKPAKWIFGPLWKTLYTSMGFASYLVWRDGGGFNGEAHNALALYAAQLAFNWAWTPIFFILRRLGLAAIDMTLLEVTIAGCVVTFYSINKAASFLMMPYLAWVTYAWCLNYWVYLHNKSEKKKSI